MRKQTGFLVVAVLFAAFTLSIQSSAQADTFGTSGNEFTIDFVNIGNAGNAADTTSYGAVPYEYRASTYEISQDAIDKATASGMANVTAGAWTGNKPVTSITWYNAAVVVNWLNTSSGYQAAYNLTLVRGSWTMALWSNADAWTLGGTNLYRNKDAYYFLPSENEWYKAAFHKNNGPTSDYWTYATASDAAPTAVTRGTAAATAVYGGQDGPAQVDQSGGLSSYGTMGQGGNASEWLETSGDGNNDSTSASRVYRGGTWGVPASFLEATFRMDGDPAWDPNDLGFRVASVPEPSTYALLLMAGVGVLWFTRKRRPIKVRALIPVVAVLFAAFAAPSLHAQLIEARAYWRGGGSVSGFLDGGGVAFDADGNLFRTQINQDLTVAEGLILKITPDGVYTSIPFPYFQPYTLALTDTGNIYVGSWFNEVAKIAPDGSVTRMYTQGSAMGMAADANGNVWVGSTGGIFRISPNDDIEVFGSFFIDGANGMAVDEDGWLYFQTSVSYPGGGFAAWPDLTLTPTTVVTGTDYLGNQQGFTFRGSVSPHPLVPNANSGDVGQRAFYTVPEPSTYALLAMTAAGALWFARKRRPIKVRALIPVVAVLFVAFTFSTQPSAQADTFGSGGNIFAIQFGAVGNTGNLPDTTGYGAVPYEYRIGLYEISGDQVAAAVQLGLSNVNAIGGGGPAVSISWLQAAAFVNWLNTSSGYQAAYNLNYSGGWNIDPWSPSEAWQLGGQNLFRNKNAYYFLPSESEWYKAAYHKNDGNTANYWKYPTASDSKPTKIEDWIGSTEPNTARYDMTRGSPPLVGPDVAGGASPYGTRGQGGNAVEYLESAFDGTNDTAFEEVTQRGGTVNEGDLYLMSTQRQSVTMNNAYDKRGFRVASVPEPSTYALLLMTAAGALWMTRRRR